MLGNELIRARNEKKAKRNTNLTAHIIYLFFLNKYMYVNMLLALK